MKLKELSLLTCLSIFTVILAGCEVYGVQGNGKFAKETRDLSSYSKVSVGGAYEVNINIASDNKNEITISGDENIVPLVKTTVRDKTLFITTTKRYSNDLPLKLEISAVSLNKLICSGANDVAVIGIDNTAFDLDLSGAGSVNLKGKTDQLTVSCSGAGSIEAKQLVAENVTVKLSGACSAVVYAEKKITASVSGVGSITYYGNPTIVNPSVSGIGSIEQAGK